jgi:hypothetical protein
MKPQSHQIKKKGERERMHFSLEPIEFKEQVGPEINWR